MGPVITAAAADRVLEAQRSLLDAEAIAIVAAVRPNASRPALLSPGLIDVTAVEERDDQEVFGPAAAKWFASPTSTPLSPRPTAPPMAYPPRAVLRPEGAVRPVLPARPGRGGELEPPDHRRQRAAPVRRSRGQREQPAPAGTGRPTTARTRSRRSRTTALAIPRHPPPGDHDPDMSERAREINLDGLVGPTHHYGGLSIGNVASQAHRHRVSHPKRGRAAGPGKDQTARRPGRRAGGPAAPRPPRRRGASTPGVHRVRRGRDPPSGARRAGAAVRVLQRLAHVGRQRRNGVAWGGHGRRSRALHTRQPSPATCTARSKPPSRPLCSNRCSTTKPCSPTTNRSPPTPELGDEGAANHMRFCPDHAHRGVEVFVYGRPETGSTEHEFPCPPVARRVAGGGPAARAGRTADPVCPTKP